MAVVHQASFQHNGHTSSPLPARQSYIKPVSHVAVVHQARFPRGGRTSSPFFARQSYMKPVFQHFRDFMLEYHLNERVSAEIGVHVRRFLANTVVWPYIKPVFQHEKSEMLENALDVRVCRTIRLKTVPMCELSGTIAGRLPRCASWRRPRCGKAMAQVPWPSSTPIRRLARIAKATCRRRPSKPRPCRSSPR